MLIRCVNSAFMLSHGVRRDTELYLLLLGPPQPPKVIRLAGERLRYLNPDERSTAALLRSALERGSPGESTPGISLQSADLESLLSKFASGLVYLKEGGVDLREAPLPELPTFLLSDHVDFSAEEGELILGHRPQVVTAGPLSLHAHHVITLVHNELDRRGF